jgi:CHAD domain-containing protein
MRSALGIFRDPIGRERAQAWRDELGDLGNHLGAARDWDVLGTQTLPPVLAAFGDEKVRRQMVQRVAHRRRREREGAREAIRSRRYAAVVLELSRWIALEEPAPPGAEAVSLPEFAARVVRKRHKQLLADAASLESLAAPERHKVRIDAKRLRYGIDALASLFPGKRVENYLDALAELQDALGHGNDAVAAGRLVAELDPPEPLAAFARGWFAANAAGDPMVYKVLLEGLESAPRFWRHAGK